tara:strand:+ start:608 stop:1087 length:480 start_codon:yes stop_codon:yes gene_type:complete
MNKEEPSTDEVENDSDETVEESTVSLSEYEKIKDDYLRLAADFDNYKKRAEKEKENIRSASVAYFVNAIFPLIDNFEMAMAQEEVAKEVDALNSILISVLQSLQVEEVGEIGESFDPALHEAVEHSGEGDSQIIDAVLRKGYLFQGSLIRPAMVKVKSE